MAKLKYLVKRIFNMNFHNFFDTISNISTKTHRSKISLFLDIIHCGFKYQAGYSDYKLYEMYNMTAAERETVVTRGKNNEIIKKYNNPAFIHYFNSKIAFNKKFNRYLNRDWLELNSDNITEFATFIHKHPTIIVKPDSLSCGKGIEILNVTEKNYTQVYNELILSHRNLVEEVVKQCPEINKLHPDSINTLRLVTLNHHLIVAFIRIGNNHNIVDNFNHGGMVAPINLETGIVDYPAIDKSGHVFDRHPLTKEPILWFKIPKWPRIKRYIEKVSYVIPEVKYVAWDVCVTAEGPILIEGNEFPGHDLYQLPPHRSNNQGLMPVFEKAMKEENKQ